MRDITKLLELKAYTDRQSVVVEELPRMKFTKTRTPAGDLRVSSYHNTLSDSPKIPPLEIWKDDAYSFFELIPEIAFVLETNAKAVASCELRLTTEDESGGIVHEIDNPKVLEVFKSLKGTTGGYERLLHYAALNLEIAGDAWFVGEPIYTDASKTQIAGYHNYEILSVLEFQIQAGAGGRYRYLRNYSGNVAQKVLSLSYGNTTIGAGLTEIDPNSYVARIWNRSPRHSMLSDCALRKVLPIAKELLKLTDLINAIANSRLSSDLLLVPEEISFGSPDISVDPGEPGEDLGDALTMELLEHMSAPVENRSSTASLVPMLMRIPAAYVDKVKLIRLGRDLDSETRIIRAELLDRLATGLNAPKELMQGTTGNHWTGFLVDSQYATRHILPIGKLIAQFLTTDFLYPMLEREGIELEEAKKYKIFFDPRNIIEQADPATIARRLYEVNAISRDALLRYSGFEPADAPGPDEIKQDLIVKLILASPVTLAPFLLPLIDGLEGVAQQVEDFLQAKVDAAAGIINTSKGIIDTRNVSGNNVDGSGLKDQSTERTGGDDNRGRPPNPDIEVKYKANEVAPNTAPPVENQGKDRRKVTASLEITSDHLPVTNKIEQANLTELINQNESLKSTLITLCHAARVRAIDKASSKLVTVARKHPELKKRIEQVDKSLLFSIITEEDEKKFNLKISSYFSTDTLLEDILAVLDSSFSEAYSNERQSFVNDDGNNNDGNEHNFSQEAEHDFDNEGSTKSDRLEDEIYEFAHKLVQVVEVLSFAGRAENLKFVNGLSVPPEILEICLGEN